MPACIRSEQLIIEDYQQNLDKLVTGNSLRLKNHLISYINRNKIPHLLGGAAANAECRYILSPSKIYARSHLEKWFFVGKIFLIADNLYQIFTLSTAFLYFVFRISLSRYGKIYKLLLNLNKMNKIIELQIENIVSHIYFIRGKKVMFDKDLAELYRVDTKVLNQAVKRNIKRFPSDFVFRLNKEETSIWYRVYSRSQIVTLGKGQNIKYYPYVFTEQGVAMLSSILKSETAIDVNIQIMRTFTKLREIMSSNSELRNKIEEMEKKYNNNFEVIFGAIKELLAEPEEKIVENKERVGFN